MGIHDGHRERMKARFREHGAEQFEDHQLLELLLFYALPRQDVNPLAHALLDHFGSLDNLLDILGRANQKLDLFCFCLSLSIFRIVCSFADLFYFVIGLS